MKILPVVLSGGAGTRLWPLSRMEYPKQFYPLHEGRSLFSATLQRLQYLGDCLNPVVVCNENHRFLVAEQVRQLGMTPGAIVLEPVGRNTAPAVALAALLAERNHGDALLLVMPSDHQIKMPKAFAEAVRHGLDEARQGGLITFGITPDRPETGFGYIQGLSSDASTTGARPIVRFVEKPDRTTAETFLASGDYFWNSGIFLFAASTYLTELRQHRPDILAACEASLQTLSSDLDFSRLDPDAFGACPAESIDYAVMEKTRRGFVVPFDAGWSDLGSWSALFASYPADAQGNGAVGDVVQVGCDNSFGYATKRLVAMLGLKETVVIETHDAILVAALDRVQEVKQLVERLQGAGRQEALTHAQVHRPWGSFEAIDAGDRFQVKHIRVKPGERLSLQKHHHRAEHWVVVNGTARIICGDTETLLSENQSTYIPIGEVHRLENPGKIELDLIEVQSGSYLGEDDIVRLEDVYGREGEK